MSLSTQELDSLNTTSQIPLWQRLLPYVGMFILALTLWLPFSFKTTGLFEELGVTANLDAGNSLYFIAPHSVMDTHRARPFEVFFHQLAYNLDPNSYLYYNIFQMLFFFGKMVVVYWLVLEFLPGRKLLAFFTSILFTIYPSDSGLFTFRTIHIHSATLLFLLALYLFIKFWRLEGRKSIVALIAGALLLLFSLMQYQVAVPMALISPLSLLYFKRPTRRFFLGSGLWYAMIAISFAYAAWATGQSTAQTYEAGIAGTTETFLVLIWGMVKGLLLGYARQVTTWGAAISKLNNLPLFVPYILLGLGIAVLVGIWLIFQQKREAATKPISRRQYALLMVSGAALFAVGIAIYLPFPLYRNEDFRIYFLGMLGSAFVLTLGLYLLSRLARRYGDVLFLILMIPFWGLALLSAFAQHRYYVNYSLVQQTALQQIARQAPQFKPDTQLVVIDPVGEMNSTYIFFHGYSLQPAVRYLYHDPTLKALYCSPKDIDVSDLICHYDYLSTVDPANHNILPQFPGADLSHQLVFMVGDDHQYHLMTADEFNQKFHTTDYNPQALLTGDQPPPRAKTLLSCDPPLSCYRLPPDAPTDTFSLPDTGEIGLGWSESSFYKDGFLRWAIYPRTTVNLNLRSDQDLALDFKMRMWMNESYVNNMKISINGQNIPFTFEPLQPEGRLYHAIIPRSALEGHPSRTQLIFSIDAITLAPGAPNYYLGWALTGLTIKPATPPS